MSIKKIIKTKRTKNPKIGDYVFLSRWQYANHNDPFFVGFIETIIEDDSGKKFRCSGSNMFFKNCWKITPSQGKRILDMYGLKEQLNER